MSHSLPRLRPALFIALALLVGSCGNDEGSGGSGSMGGETDPTAEGVASYQETPEAIESGRRIFEAQVCSRCHKEGGVPAIGPNLHDDEWLYGGEPDNIFASIMHGRPRGMAPYQGRLSAQEVWHLVAYLRSSQNAE